MDDGINQLSDSQRLILGMVAENKSSKEIALETGLSPHTVDTYLARAIAALGVSNRREAARLFLSRTQSEKSISKPERIEKEIDPGEPERALSQGVKRSGRWLRVVQLPSAGGKRHELTPNQVIYAILKASFVSTAIIAIMLTIYFWVHRLALS